MCLVVFPYLQHFRFFAVDGWGLLFELDSVSTLLCRKNKSWNYDYAKDVQNTKLIFRIFLTLSALTEVRTGRTDRSLWTTNKLFSEVLAERENHQLLFDLHDDDDDNENDIIAIGWDQQNKPLHGHHTFLCISQPSLQDHNMKMPNFTFCGGSEHKTTIFFSFFLSKSQTGFRIQLQKNSLTSDKLNDME